jgi:hypothetical protein
MDKSYIDTLIVLRAEQKEQAYNKPINEPLVDLPFNDWLVCVSNELPPVDTSLYYKSANAQQHKYTLNPPTNPNTLNKPNTLNPLTKLSTLNILNKTNTLNPPNKPNTSDPFDETYLLLQSKYGESVDGDFLTGYYLAKLILLLTPQTIYKSFHAGISSDSITRGIYYAFQTPAKKPKWINL